MSRSRSLQGTLDISGHGDTRWVKALAVLVWAFLAPVVLCLPDLLCGVRAAALGEDSAEAFHSAVAQSPPVIPQAWVSREDGIGALFPTAPEKVAAEQASVTGHAYQAVKEYESCIVLYTVTVIPNLPGEKLPPPGLSWTAYFRQLSMVFADSIGVPRGDLVLLRGAVID